VRELRRQRGYVGNCSRANRSASNKREINCVVHAGRSECSDRYSGGRSADGRSRNIAIICVRSCARALTPRVDAPTF
jgi:hypothetical protein